MAVEKDKGKAPMPLYQMSTQFRHWRFSMEQLDSTRQQLNAQAVKRAQSMIEEERSERTKASTSAASAELPPPPAEIEYLTVSDELQLVTYYLTQASALCNAFKFPEAVQATAMSYIKRFYLSNTCMDYHPKNIMLTCVFLASKVENCPVSIDSFASKTKVSPQDILELEFLVSQSLRFEYKVHHAHQAVHGLLLDMQASTSASAIDVDKAYRTALQRASTSRLTDVELMYAPSQIALALYRFANAELVDEYISAKRVRMAEDAPSATTMNDDDALIELLDEIDSAVQVAIDHKVNKEAVTAIDRRLRWARNPEKDPNSALYKKRKAEEEQQRKEKDSTKAGRPDDGSVFD